MKPVAIVIGQGGYNDIGLVRSCGEAGMIVVLICPEHTVIPIHKSRYVCKWVPTDVYDSELCFSAIKSVVEELSGSPIALFPASDGAALLIDSRYSWFEGKAFVPHAFGRLESLMDKSVMAVIAGNSSLKVPACIRCDLSIDAAPGFSGNCIIKPLRSVNGGKSVITICKTPQEYNLAVCKCKESGVNEIIIQRLIEGPRLEEVAVTGVSLPDGRVVTYGMIHKRRIRGNGSTVYAKYAVTCPPAIQQGISRFMAESRYTGIFDVEFLFDDKDYYFIECNYRNGAYGYALTSAGFNMPAIFFDGVRLDRIADVNVHDVVFMEERSDVLNAIEKKVPWLTWLKELLTVDTLLWWNWRDPKPMLRTPYFIKKLFVK